MSMLVKSRAGKSAAPWAEADVKADKSGVHHAVFWPSRNGAYLEAQRLGNRTAESEFKVGARYVGDWAGNQKSGFGVQTWTNGRRYEGEWSRGKQNGVGTMLVRRGAKGKAMRKEYVGDWREGKRHGTGVFHFANGDRYDGEWVDGKAEGRGKLAYANGDMYEGNWLSGDRSGLGVLSLANGDRYEGHWLGDEKEGPGRFFYFSTNKVYEGEWVGGVAKCGTFENIPAAMLGGGASAAAAAASVDNFDLPSLELSDATRVMGDAVTSLRQDRAAATGEQSVVFGAAELEQLRQEFELADPTGSGTIPCSQLGSVLMGLGMSPTDDEVDMLIRDIGAEPDTPISFAEFIDIMALLSAE